MIAVQYAAATVASLSLYVVAIVHLVKTVEMPQMAATVAILTASSVSGLLPHAIQFAPLIPTAKKVPTIAYCATLFENYAFPHCLALAQRVPPMINVWERVMEPQFVMLHKKGARYPSPIMALPAFKMLTV